MEIGNAGKWRPIVLSLATPAREMKKGVVVEVVVWKRSVGIWEWKGRRERTGLSS